MGSSTVYKRTSDNAGGPRKKKEGNPDPEGPMSELDYAVALASHPGMRKKKLNRAALKKEPKSKNVIDIRNPLKAAAFEAMDSKDREARIMKWRSQVMRSEGQKLFGREKK